jgi:DNA polymerase-3 subunit beta
MEIIASKGTFLKAISLIASVVSTKTATLPILGNVLLETIGTDQLQIIGTDLEVGITTKVQVEIKEKGSITLPAKKMMDIVRELPEGNFEISVAKNNAVNIKSGKAFFKIMGLGKEDYPKLPEWKEENAYEIEQAILKECLGLTIFAISNDETRYVLNGILLSIEGNKIRFVATDGRRLAFAERNFENKTHKNRYDYSDQSHPGNFKNFNMGSNRKNYSVAKPGNISLWRNLFNLAAYRRTFS